MLQSFWITKINDCDIAISPCPSGGQNLEKELKSLVLEDQLLVISLLTDQEVIDEHLQKEKVTCEKSGIEFKYFPIIEGSIPGAFNFIEFVEEIYPLTNDLDRIIIHCNRGRSRSSMVTIGLMLKHGLILGESIQLASKIRGSKVPKHPSQVKLLKYYAESL